MPRRLSLYGVLLSTALGACSDSDSGPRLNFIGATGLTSNDRVLTTPGDSLVTRVFADNRDGKGPELRRFRIKVDYTPLATKKDTPNTPDLVYLDQAITGSTFYYLHRFSARTQSGRERWTFEVEDVEGNKDSRRYLLTVNNSDSARTFHSYQVPLYAARSASSRSSLAARDGLVFPAYPLLTDATLQASIDLVLIPAANGTVALAAPNDENVSAAAEAVGANAWTTRNATSLKVTALTPAQFDALNTSALITSSFDASPAAVVPNTGVLAKDRVIAFRTATGRTGALHVKELFGTTAAPAAIVRVKVNR
ncbi:hypothetical protein LRS06_09270 [Hymenobacter sp. J193]|uniref:hypothetical protein n=1 Tax=Hymenobacter sp. J193 TaxID=2898429 RepID=UPI002151632F|nr:hypothetical protein [Hymenobacter sp. J193]MCR5887966.1 hypothetical protein [Hymenobacter sp. J193]